MNNIVKIAKYVKSFGDKEAYFDKKLKQLTYFNSKNTSISVNCDSAQKAKKIIDLSGIDQKLILRS